MYDVTRPEALQSTVDFWLPLPCLLSLPLPLEVQHLRCCGPSLMAFRLLHMPHWMAVYDVTRPDTLQSIVDFWLPEFERHSSWRDAVKMIVGNKIDKVGLSLDSWEG